MAILSICKYPDPVLAETAAPVEEITPDLQRLIDDMAETMYQAPGIGLAANQVGSLDRVIICDITPRDQGRNLMVLINPEIIAASGETVHEEGCLSVDNFTADVRRNACVTVTGLDRQGRPQKIEAQDLLAVVLQHEIDHLNGTLFIDRISRLKRSLYKRHVKKQMRA